MPSLPTNHTKSHSDNYYNYHTENILRQYNLCDFICFLAEFLFSSIICCTPFYILGYIVTTQSTYYFDHKFYYLWDFYFILTHSLYQYCIIIIITYYPTHDRCKILTLSLLTNVIIAGSLFIIIQHFTSETTNTFIDIQIVPNCILFYCPYGKLNNLYFHVIFPTLFPFLSTAIYICISSKISGINQNDMEQSLLNEAVIELGSVQSDNDSIQSNKYMDQHWISNSKKHKFIMIVSLFWITMFIYLLCIYFLIAVDYSYLRNHKIFNHFTGFTIWFVILSFTTSLFKFIAKRICRLIDIYRTIICANNKNIKQYKISMELMVEFWFSMIYWFLYRYYSLIELSRMNINNFFFALIIHLIPEIHTSFIRYLAYYHKVSKHFMEYISSKSNVFAVILRFFGNSKSNLKQWRIRGALDINMRFLASIMTAIGASIWNVIVDHKYLNETNRELITGQIYNVILFCVDITFYMVLILFNVKVHQFEIWIYVLNIHHRNKYAFLGLLVISSVFLSGLTFWG